MAPTCYVCGNAILEKHLLKIDDNLYHSHCVRCSECQCSLSNTCYHRDGAIYCLDDFTRLFGSKCHGCDSPLYPSDIVHKIPRGGDIIIYHVTCFRCSVCDNHLTTDCEFYFNMDGKIVCRDDYAATESDDSSLSNDHATNNFEINSDNVTQPGDVIQTYDMSCDVSNSQQDHSDLSLEDFLESKLASPPWMQNDVVTDNVADDVTAKSETDFDALSNHSPNPEKQIETLSVTGSANQKRRGPRTTIKAKQLETLKSAFATTPKPTRHIREQLAQDTGLTMRVIQVWFQNRRSKERRMKQMNVLSSRRHFFDRNVQGVLLRESIQQSDCLVANTRVQQQYYTGLEQPLPSQNNFNINYPTENIHGVRPDNWNSHHVPNNLAEKDNLFHPFNTSVKNMQHRDQSSFYNTTQQGYSGVNF